MPQANLSKLDHWCFKGLGTLIEMLDKRSQLGPIDSVEYAMLIKAHGIFARTLYDTSIGEPSKSMNQIQMDYWMLLGLQGMVKIITTRMMIDAPLGGIKDALEEQVGILRSLL